MSIWRATTLRRAAAAQGGSSEQMSTWRFGDGGLFSRPVVLFDLGFEVLQALLKHRANHVGHGNRHPLAQEVIILAIHAPGDDRFIPLLFVGDGALARIFLVKEHGILNALLIVRLVECQLAIAVVARPV